MESQYDTQEWAACTTLGRHIFNHNYRMTGNEFRGWKLVNSVVNEPESGVTEKIYIWQKADGNGQEQVRISITELPNWRHAQLQLHERLLHSMRPNIPGGAGRLAKTGDVGFVGQERQSDVVAALSFVRGNVSVSVNSVGDALVDVSSMAKKLDRDLSEPPKKEEVAKGRAQVLPPERLTLRENELATVVEKLPPAGWLKLIAPDGELSRQDDGLVYGAAGSGKKEVAKYLMVQ